MVMYLIIWGWNTDVALSVHTRQKSAKESTSVFSSPAERDAQNGKSLPVFLKMGNEAVYMGQNIVS